MARKSVAKKSTQAKAAAPSANLPPRVAESQLLRNELIFTRGVETTDKKGAKQQATTDGFDNFISRVGLNNNNALSGGTYTFNYITKNRIRLEAAYRGSWVVGAVVDSVAEDMTRMGIAITTNEQDADIKDVQSLISKLQIWASLQLLVKWSRLYGGAIAVLQIDGQDLSTPLRPETVDKGQFLGLTVYDRWQLNPVTSRPIKEGPMMGLPEIYQIVTNLDSMDSSVAANATGVINVHHTRILRMTGIDLPYFQAITEMMWGESVLERLWDRLIAFDNVTMSVASLVDRANLRMVGIDGLREILAAGGKAQEGLVAQFDMMRLLQVNEGLTLLDKEDEYQTSSYSFAGISDTILQFGQQLSGASGIPLVRLFGQSPAGLSSTGDADIRMYYDNIRAQQESKLRRGIDTLLKVLWRSQYGKDAPKDLEFQFAPLWQTSELDQATIAKSNTETIIGAVDAGLMSKPSAMKELRESSGDTGMFSNITDEDIAEVEAEPPMPDAPPEAVPEPEAEAEKKDVPALDRKWWAPWKK